MNFLLEDLEFASQVLGMSSDDRERQDADSSQETLPLAGAVEDRGAPLIHAEDAAKAAEAQRAAEAAEAARTAEDCRKRQRLEDYGRLA